MIKAIIFDLDGVLVDADKWHYNALNVALQHSKIEPISWQEHLTIYKGIPTKKKLSILTERKGLPLGLHDKINQSKQKVITDMIYEFCFPDLEKIEMMKLLSRKYKIYVCSNAVRQTVQLMLTDSELEPFVDFFLSNEDVDYPKPNPQIYLKIFERTGLKPTECVIVEDSDVGYQAAVASEAFICKVEGPEEVNYYRVLKSIIESERINIVIPAGGYGKRFTEEGYQHPKPLIDVNGRPMLELVLDNFKNIGRKIIVMQKKQIDKYCVESVFKHKDASIEIVAEEGILRGAATGVLIAKPLIDNNNELIIANSDQVVDINISEFIQYMRDLDADGGILTFKAGGPKWSYAKYDSTGLVSEVAEKNPISDQATVGIYYYKRGKDFVKYAEQMIAKNIRTNNEFYVCPVYNEFIQDGKKIYIKEIFPMQMHGLGTPEDLKLFLQEHNN